MKIVLVEGDFMESEGCQKIGDALQIKRADTRSDGYRGTNLEPLRSGACLVFVFNETEIGPVQTLFPNAKVVASGSLHLEKFFFPELTQVQARNHLGIKQNETMILAPGRQGFSPQHSSFRSDD